MLLGILIIILFVFIIIFKNVIIVLGFFVLFFVKGILNLKYVFLNEDINNLYILEVFFVNIKLFR